MYYSFFQAFLSNEDLGDSLDSVEALIKKHEDFEKSLAAQEEKIKALDEFATKLIEGQHYATEDVAQRRELVNFRFKFKCLVQFFFYPYKYINNYTYNFQLLERRTALLAKSSLRRSVLEDSYRLQQFERDCDETKGWINEKLKFANDDSYLVNIKLSNT